MKLSHHTTSFPYAAHTPQHTATPRKGIVCLIVLQLYGGDRNTVKEA